MIAPAKVFVVAPGRDSPGRTALHAHPASAVLEERAVSGVADIDPGAGGKLEFGDHAATPHGYTLWSDEAIAQRECAEPSDIRDVSF